jgi:hypothetical protein
MLRAAARAPSHRHETVSADAGSADRLSHGYADAALVALNVLVRAVAPDTGHSPSAAGGLSLIDLPSHTLDFE